MLPIHKNKNPLRQRSSEEPEKPRWEYRTAVIGFATAVVILLVELVRLFAGS